MKEGTKQKLLEFFHATPSRRTTNAQRKLDAQGKTTIEDDGWGMLHYVLDNLHLENEQLVQGLMAYTHDPNNRKNPYTRVDWMVHYLWIDDRYMSEAECRQYRDGLREDGSLFNGERNIGSVHADDLALSKDEFILETVKYIRSISKTFQLLNDPNELEIGAVNPRSKSPFPDLILDEEDLLETMRAQGFLQCDLDR